uniref:Integrase catalytic domain-containing protein n=1 Tax=Tanacetum cinerariifolium TaxID=118510 RepID=A0A6L2J945_TANCI|nr:hypothetical protein [Tanacetum cinerariifolium]
MDDKNNLIILKQWTINTSLLKEELNRVLVWVKFHDVPLEVFDEEGISIIGSHIGKPIMLDAYASAMCFTKELITVKYEWKPLRCDMLNKKRNNKRSSAGNKLPKGVPVAKGFQVVKEFNYQPRATSTSANGGGTRGKDNSTAGPSKESNEGVSLSNKSTLNDKQKDNDVVDTGAMKMSNIFSLTRLLFLGRMRKKRHARLMRNRPWVLLGDFNAALNIEDRVASDYEPIVAMDPSSFTLREEHAYYLLAFKEAQLDEERFLKQKAKIEWLKAGDANTAYFHKIVKSKCARNRFDMVSDASNNTFDGNQGSWHPDSFSAAFFKKAWDVVGGDITCAIRDFFSNGKLLKELNHTIISLIPKVTTPACINDYRLISYCNVLYKCISKIIANRVKEGLGDIVSTNQSAFVLGRRISDNIVLTQELMRNYHRRRGPLRLSNGLWSVFLGLLTLYVLMVTCMVGLKRRVQDSDDFQYHHLCEQQRIINLCFADDLLYFPVLESRVNDWRNKFISLVGRLQLVRLVLSSMHIYWASIFILPNRIVHYLEQLMRGFLWCQREMNKGKAKVAWDSVCMPKHEGGLGRSFRDVPCRGDVSWGWRKLLQIKSTIRLFIWHKINNGKSTSAWFDRWADMCLPKDMFSNKDIARSCFSLEDSVNNLISDGVWRLPIDWLSRFSTMAQFHVLLLFDDIDDVILWRDRDGVLRPFFVSCAWDSIQTRADIKKLKKQDRLRQWDVGPSIDLNLLRCSLCDLVPDSPDHLFFECAFSLHAWSKVRVLYGMDSIPSRLIDVSTFIIPISKGKTALGILSRHVLAATSYYIWLKRNGRLFKTKTSSPDQIVNVIISMVRLKLVTFKFKKMSTRSRLLLDQWKISSYCIVHDGSFRYQNEVKNQLGRKIKVLRSDRRGEYLSIKFFDHLKNYGIVSQLTPPITPLLNGVAERRTRTLLDMVRSMMCRATLPIRFWGYALETAAHILNLVPTKKVSKTTFEMWKGKRPSFGHIKIWDCEDNVVFVSRKGVFLEREMISKEDSRSKIDHEEIQESVDEESIVNTDTKQEVVTPVEPDDISLPIRRTNSRVIKPSQDPQFYYGFHIEEDKISDSTLTELNEPYGKP